MTTPTSMGNHGGTVTSCSPYAYPGFAEICILLRTWSTVAPGTYELAFLIKKKKDVLDRGIGQVGSIPIPDFIWDALAPSDFSLGSNRDLGPMRQMSDEGLTMARALVRGGVLSLWEGGGG